MGKNAHGILFAAGEKVLTPGILAKKAGVWHDLSSKGADLWIFGKKGSHVAQPPQCKKHKKKSLKCVFITVTIDFIISKYILIQILVNTVNKFCELLVKCLTHRLDGLF